VFERRGPRTVLTARRFTLPLQALEPMTLGEEASASLLLLNPTGGILGGDRLETEVVLQAGAHVVLSTPSATRVYRSPERPAVQRTALTLGPGAVLEWLPDHLIPSPGARLQHATEITMAAEATLIHWDAWATGRAARAETWAFDLLDTRVTARDPAGLLARERAVLRGGPRLDSLGGTEGFGYVGTLLLLAPDRPRWPELTGALHAALVGAAPDCRTGVTALARGGLLARVLAPRAPALSAALAALWAHTRHALLGLPPLDLRKL
jgi:urease accessory protein